MPKKKVETVYIHFIVGLAIMLLIMSVDHSGSGVVQCAQHFYDRYF